MKKNMNFITIFVLILILIGLISLYFLKNSNIDTENKIVVKNNTGKVVEEKPKRIYDENNCDIKKEKFNVNGSSMQPLIKNASEVTVNMNYYNCEKNKITSGDVVIFENPFSLERVIKKVAIVPGDTIEINKEDKTIKVNGAKFVNSEEKDYIFDENELKWFDIYTQSGVVKGGEYFLFGDNISDSIDSRNYGPVSKEGILGKVEL